MPGTRKLGRPTAHRMMMLRNLTTALLENGKIDPDVFFNIHIKMRPERLHQQFRPTVLKSRVDLIGIPVRNFYIRIAFKGYQLDALALFIKRQHHNRIGSGGFVKFYRSLVCADQKDVENIFISKNTLLRQFDHHIGRIRYIFIRR